MWWAHSDPRDAVADGIKELAPKKKKEKWGYFWGDVEDAIPITLIKMLIDVEIKEVFWNSVHSLHTVVLLISVTS